MAGEYAVASGAGSMNFEPSYTDSIRPWLDLCDPLQVLDMIAVPSIRLPPRTHPYGSPKGCLRALIQIV